MAVAASLAHQFSLSVSHILVILRFQMNLHAQWVPRIYRIYKVGLVRKLSYFGLSREAITAHDYDVIIRELAVIRKIYATNHRSSVNGLFEVII